MHEGEGSLEKSLACKRIEKKRKRDWASTSSWPLENRAWGQMNAWGSNRAIAGSLVPPAIVCRGVWSDLVGVMCSAVS